MNPCRTVAEHDYCSYIYDNSLQLPQYVTAQSWILLHRINKPVLHGQGSDSCFSWVGDYPYMANHEAIWCSEIDFT